MKSTNLLLISVLALGFLLRLPLLGGSFWLDEAAQALESVRPFSQQFDIIDDFQPPLIHLLLHLAQFVSWQEWWLRLWGALIPGLVTIWATIRLGRAFVKKQGLWQVSFVAGLLLATHSFHIFFSQELRPYSLPAMWAVLGWLSLWELAHQKPTKHTSCCSKWLVLLATSSFLGIYSSYLYPFVILGQLVAAWWLFRPVLKQVILSVSLAGLGFMPWIPIFLSQLTAGRLVQLNLPGWSEVVSFPPFKSLPLVFGRFVFGVIPVDISIGFVVISVVLVAGLGWLWWQHHKNLKSKTTKPQALKFVLIWLTVPLFTAWAFSFILPVLQPKRVLFLLPAWTLLIAILVTPWLADFISQLRSLPKSLKSLPKLLSKPPITPLPKPLVAGAILLGVLLLNLYGTLNYYAKPHLQREDWRSLHQEILESYPAEKSLAVFSFPAPFAPWEWYDDGQYLTFSTGYLFVDKVDDLPLELQTAVSDKDYVLVFDYLRDLTDPQDKILSTLVDLGYKHRDTLDRPGIGFVRVYMTKEAATAYLE